MIIIVIFRDSNCTVACSQANCTTKITIMKTDKFPEEFICSSGDFKFVITLVTSRLHAQKITNSNLNYVHFACRLCGNINIFSDEIL